MHPVASSSPFVPATLKIDLFQKKPQNFLVLLLIDDELSCLSQTTVNNIHLMFHLLTAGAVGDV